jgi:hypothetical protein
MHNSSLRVLLVFAATWAAALCVIVHPLLGLLVVGLFALAELASIKGWLEPGTIATVVLLGWALFILVLNRTTSPGATMLFGISGFLMHALYVLLGPQRKEGHTP